MAGRQMTPGQHTELQRRFNAIDKDRSGTLDAKELRAALSYGGQEFREEVARLMIRTYDTNNTGTIGFHDFCQLFQFLTVMSEAYQAADFDHNGYIDKTELLSILHNTGFRFSDETLTNVMTQFETTEREGRLTYDGFIEMTLFLNYVESMYVIYDPKRTGRVNISFDVFVSMSCLIRGFARV